MLSDIQKYICYITVDIGKQADDTNDKIQSIN